MLAEWEEKLDGWKFGKFATMDVNEIEAVAGQFAKRVYKLGKDPAVRGWKVVESLKERVDNLKKLMPLIADLRNPAMRERHWKSLMEEVGKVFDPHSDDFTLDAVLQLGFDQHEETIGTLSNAAGKELAIEEAIAKIEVQWEELALDLAEYKEYLKLRSVDDVYSNPNPVLLTLTLTLTPTLTLTLPLPLTLPLSRSLTLTLTLPPALARLAGDRAYGRPDRDLVRVGLRLG